MLVEAALILPLLLLIVFGIIEFSLAYKASINVSAAVRSGVRSASAEPRQATFYADVKAATEKALSPTGQDTPKELWIYNADEDGYPVGTGKKMQCIASKGCQKWTNWDSATHGFTDPSTTDSASLPTSWKAGPAGNQQSCLFPDSFSAHPSAGHAIESVGVYVRVEHKAIASLFTAAVGKDTFTIDDRAIARFEPTPAGQLGC